MRQLRCTKHRHRTLATVAKCLIPGAAWYEGQGPFALIAWCGRAGVSLHADQPKAERDKELIDSTGCGGSCRRRHEIVRLVR